MAVALFGALFAAASDPPLTDAQRRRAAEDIVWDRPNLVAVDAVEFSGRAITIRGTGTNVNAVANFAENIKSDPLFTVPDVDFIRVNHTPSGDVYEYQFRTAVK